MNYRVLPNICKIFVLPLLIIFAAVTRNDGHSAWPRIFLTFDDGPINATLDILDVLKEQGVRATFFVNGNHLRGEGGEREDRAGEALRRLVAEGHVLGNHSYDHMRHNNQPYDPARLQIASYREIDVDYRYFLPLNTLVVENALGDLRFRPNNCMWTLGRLPYSNNWRIPGLAIDCPCCTVDREGTASGNGMCSISGQRISDSAYSSALLSDRLYAAGMQLFGWDIHWQPVDWSASAPSETVPPVRELVRAIDAAIAGTDCAALSFHPDKLCQVFPRRGKVVVLVHDFLFENSFRGRGADLNLPKLRELIVTLKKRGYVFESLDRYFDAF
jgi:chitin disaccharide deacetylase